MYLDNVSMSVTYSDKSANEVSLYFTNFDAYIDVSNQWMVINVPVFSYAFYSFSVACVNLGGVSIIYINGNYISILIFI